MNKYKTIDNPARETPL